MFRKSNPQYTPPPMPPVKPPAKPCVYIEICPSASGWCDNNQPSDTCIPFLDTAENRLMCEINTVESIKEYIYRKCDNDIYNR